MNARRSRLATIFSQISLALVCCLPFLVPFEPYRSIELQGLLLVLAGAFAWSAVALQPAHYLAGTPRSVQLLLAIYIGFALLSSVVNPEIARNLLGARLLELGSLGLIACLGCGLVIRQVPKLAFIRELYRLIVVAGVVSVPFSLIKYHTIERLPGIFFQADVMAIVLGCGVLVGLYMIEAFPKQQRTLLVSQLVLLCLLMLTGTRIAIAGTILLVVIYVIRQRSLSQKWPMLVAGLAICSVVALASSSAGRLTDANFASQSVGYRYALQSAGLRASSKQPIFGYGAGRVATALQCSDLHDPALTLTCAKGFYFNSSHNIFLDRVLAFGWIGGLSYLLIIGTILAKYWHRTRQPVIVYCIVLISLYYLTNVTNVALELLFCCLLLRLVPQSHFDKA